MATQISTQIIPGAMRETNNPLLLKADVGKSLKRGFVLPPISFTYGKTHSDEKNIGAGDTFSWRTKQDHPLTAKDKNRERDFVAINKEATKAGLVTAKEHFQYRATHEVSPPRRGRVIKNTSADIPRDKVFGMPTKPSTPVFDLLEHKYQNKWIEETQLTDLSRVREEKEQLSQATKPTYGDTRACRLRRHSPPVECPPLWQMPKFQKNAVAALQTFRSADAKGRAFKHHGSDCTARTGVFGHGVYESAKY